MFEDDVVNLTRKEYWKSVLGSSAREAVLPRIRRSSTQNAKKRVTLEPKQKRLNRISFYHRFSKGGRDTELIFLPKSKKIYLKGVPEEFYADESYRNRKSRHAKGYFGIGVNDEPLEISVYLHRELPEEKIKIVQFTGLFSDITRKWNWQIVFTI